MKKQKLKKPETKSANIVTTELAVEALKKYLYPMRENDRLVLEIELDAVINLTNPKLGGEWTWAIDEALLAQGIRSILEVGTTHYPTAVSSRGADILINAWDTSVGDGTDAHGYSISIKTELTYKDLRPGTEPKL